MAQRITSGFVAMAIWAVAMPTHALQVINVTETDNAIVKVSMREITRIKVQNARIAKVRAREGLLAIEPDPQRNEYFIRPLTSARNISMFLTTDAGQTFNLQLQPEDIPSTTVVLKAAISGRGTSDSLHAKEAYRSNLKARMVAMANEDIADAQVEEMNVRLGLWQDTMFVLNRRYVWDNYIGEVYTLTNQSERPLDMLEREFFHPGVAAVTVEQLHLAKNQTTRVYVIKNRESD